MDPVLKLLKVLIANGEPLKMATYDMEDNSTEFLLTVTVPSAEENDSWQRVFELVKQEKDTLEREPGELWFFHPVDQVQMKDFIVWVENMDGKPVVH